MFERFTDAARRVVARAQEKARELKSAEIGCEHLLLSVVDDAGIDVALTATSWPSETIRDAVLAEIATRSPERRPPSPLNVPFTPVAKQALESALRESLREGSGSITAAHLLLGVVSAADDPAAVALAHLGVTADLLRPHLLSADQPRRGATSPPARQPGPALGPWVAEVTRRAHGWAEALGAGEVRAEHVLLAVLNERDSAALAALRDSGADLAALRDALLDLGSE
ncbi:MAG: Clp protease N-terminal domain-containing protein [Tetrasphaera sp.]